MYKKVKDIKNFEAAYNRSGYIELAHTECDACGKTAKCVSIDSSEGEYGSGSVCKECIDAAYNSTEETNESTESLS